MLKAVSMGDFYGALDGSNKYDFNRHCAWPGCERIITNRARYCKPHAQQMRRKVEGQTARLLTRAAEKREALRRSR